ncbi:hypothetical protein LMG23992_04216 [Cupriavidus laharis]|uniref:FtsK gamma domain-containing protein n=1 Tax=Cupriavidus laharis TaxID=151654 RepID=A0ABN7Z341_9BURK|nr:DNA translocase FtsK [Cupriavidus laharis]CAG9180335.1 hypothetical protein LMG23992_04216 [Cupriavidus laharis]
MTKCRRDPQLSSPEAFEAAYVEAIDLVHTFRAASISLVQRRLRIGYEAACRLLARMASETTFVLPTQGGLYLYAPSAIGSELASLRGFARTVIRALQAGDLNPDVLRAEALRYGLATETPIDGPCSPTCACAELLDFPVQCFRPATHAGAAQDGDPALSTSTGLLPDAALTGKPSA